MPYLEFEHLLRLETQVSESTRQFTLLESLLRASHRLQHGRRTTDKDLGLFTLVRARKILLDVLLGDKALLCLHVLRCFIQKVDNLEAVVLADLIEFLAQKDVSLRLVTVKERDLRLVSWVRRDFLNQLPHGGDTRTTGNHADLLKLVGLVRMLGNRALEVHFITGLQALEILRHLALRVVFDEQHKLALVGRRVHGCVGTNDGLSILVLGLLTSATYHKRRCSKDTRTLVVRQLEHVKRAVVVVWAHLLELQRTELVTRESYVTRVGIHLLDLRADIAIKAAHRVPCTKTSDTTGREIQTQIRRWGVRTRLAR